MKDELEINIRKAQQEAIMLSQAETSKTPLAIVTDSISPMVERPRMIMNPNKDVALKIIERIYKCDGKCPCQPKDSLVDTRCPCPDFTGRGICHCNLFVAAKD